MNMSSIRLAIAGISMMCLLLGGAGGIVWAKYDAAKARLRDAAWSSGATISMHRTVLESLDKGDVSEARQLLSTHMKTQSMSLHAMLAFIPANERDPALVKQLELAKAYQSNEVARANK